MALAEEDENFLDYDFLERGRDCGNLGDGSYSDCYLVSEYCLHNAETGDELHIVHYVVDPTDCVNNYSSHRSRECIDGQCFDSGTDRDASVDVTGDFDLGTYDTPDGKWKTLSREEAAQLLDISVSELNAKIAESKEFFEANAYNYISDRIDDGDFDD